MMKPPDYYPPRDRGPSGCVLIVIALVLIALATLVGWWWRRN